MADRATVCIDPERPAVFFTERRVVFVLPGLIYSVFIRLGIARKVAWHWMWLLPAGFNYALQAGSVANDAFGAVFALGPWTARSDLANRGVSRIYGFPYWPPD